MPGRVHDKVVLVTGAGCIGPGWGNGKAAAVLYAREGAKVFAVDLNHDAALETCAIIREEGGECCARAADVSDSAAVSSMVDECVTEFGRVDILHNNVGVPVVGGVEEIDEGTWDQQFLVNVKSNISFKK